MKPELRRDPVVGRWVIIADERENRPTDFGAERVPLLESLCPFCAGNESETPPEIFSVRRSPQGPWSLRVVPNSYPALHAAGALERTSDEMYERMDGFGTHEVIVETPHHGFALTDLPAAELLEVVWAYRRRMDELQAVAGVRYTMVFRNHGRAAGASLSHPHSQLVGLPFVPKRVAEELAGADGYHRSHGRCIFCDIANKEIRRGERLIERTEHFAALAPFAARFPFETWILPIEHSPSFEHLGRSEAAELSELLWRVLARLRDALGDPAYNYLIHSTPYELVDCPFYHWHIEIIPRLTRVAGFEWGTGFYINPTPPEEAARLLRETSPGGDEGRSFQRRGGP
jgi:UDPglucose--hexose-1-phosphate uridylyltransferase